ncbi:hypothetical protein [Microbacterium murale]|uniref:Uncharacterized protein n=1 Tax=Microbacterium murale TaxID=1081040 RepID=A0ABU0PBH3_9MICO|nr:hypothetical protein [Microbacterium murale]MDQ0644684.1 hypothetical protein [Microbacterium murale]
MNEIQGPTPAGTSRPYRNLSEALRAHRIDTQNHEFIVSITDAVGISSFIDRGRYIEAIRLSGGTPLHIGKTYTNGFAEDEQVVVGATALRLRPSEGREPYFYVTHPSELRPVAEKTATARAPRKVASSVSAARPTKTNERDYGTCDVCFMVRTASGKCSCDS